MHVCWELRADRDCRASIAGAEVGEREEIGALRDWEDGSAAVSHGPRDEVGAGVDFACSGEQKGIIYYVAVRLRLCVICVHASTHKIYNYTCVYKCLQI